MQENIYARIHKTLSWKRIASFNVVLLLVLIIPLSVSISQQDTENRSGAAEEAPIVIPPPNYPIGAPKIDRVSTFFGKTGDTIIVIGSNFGDYQWESKLFVGNTLATSESIVRWSNNILEVKIPESARTGAVWIVSNNKEARWEGSLLLYDVLRGAQIGLQKTTGSTGKLYTTNASGVVRGMVELAYVSEPLEIVPAAGIVISNQVVSNDSLGKKIKIEFESPLQMNSGRSEIAEYKYPGIGNIEIIRAELYDINNKLYSIFADPLMIKVTP